MSRINPPVVAPAPSARAELAIAGRMTGFVLQGDGRVRMSCPPDRTQHGFRPHHYLRDPVTGTEITAAGPTEFFRVLQRIASGQVICRTGGL